MSKSATTFYCIQPTHPETVMEDLSFRITKKSPFSGYRHGGESYVVELDAAQTGNMHAEGEVTDGDVHCTCVGFRMWRKPPRQHKHIVLALMYSRIAFLEGYVPMEFSINKDGVCSHIRMLPEVECPLI